MTEETTNPVDGEAMPEVVDALASENEALESSETNQENESGEPNEDADLEEVEFEGEQFRLPKKLKDGLLRQADYTKKTQEVAEQRKSVEARQAEIQQIQERQTAFAQDIAQLGALNARLAPFAQVQDWPSYIRTGGPAAQADYAEYQALVHQRDQFANGLTQRIHDRDAEQQRAFATLVETGRAEIKKYIPDYSTEVANKLADFGGEYGFSRDEILQAESDPRSIRVLHDAMIGRQLREQQAKTQSIAIAQNTKPVQTLRGTAGGKAPDRMNPAEMAKLLGY